MATNFSQQFPFFNDLIAQRVLRSIDSVELNFLAQCISEALQTVGENNSCCHFY